MKRKNLFPTLWTSILLILGALACISTASSAATRALTTITNQATATYSNQNSVGSYNASSNIKTLTVAYKVVINAPSASTATPGLAATDVTASLAILNSGNYTDAYDITYLGTFLDANGDGAMDNGESFGTPWTVTYGGTPMVVGTPISTAALKDAGIGGGPETATQNVVATIPDISQYNDKFIVVLEIKSKAQEGVPAALHIVNPADTVQWILPVLIRKPHIVLTVDQPTGTTKVPGTSVTYTVHVGNDGPVASLAGTLSFTPGSAFAPGTVQTFPIGVIAGGGTAPQAVSATIERSSNNGTGIPSGTSVNVSTANISFPYTVFGYSHTVYPSSVTPFTVDRARGVSIVEYATPKVQDVEPGVPASYYFKLKNEGNANSSLGLTDNFVFTKTQSAGTSGYLPSDMVETYTYYVGTINGVTPTDPATASYGSSIGSGSPVTQAIGNQVLSGGEERWVKVVVTAPASAQNDESRTFTFHVGNADQTGNAVMNIGSYFTSTEITGYQLTVKAPKLTIVLSHESISGQSTNPESPYPGDIITFLIHVTNVGTKDAKLIVVTQVVPGAMTFQTKFGSTEGQGITIDGTEVTNASDSDGAFYNAGTTTVQTDPFTLASSGTKDIRFKAMVQ